MYWEKTNCLYSSKGNSKCWFDPHSFLHFGTTSFIYAFLLIGGEYFNIQTRGALIFWGLVNLIHIIDELLNNFTYLSFENIWHMQKDNDSTQNAIGDIICGLVGTTCIFLTFYLTKPKYRSLFVLAVDIIFSCIVLGLWLHFK